MNTKNIHPTKQKLKSLEDDGLVEQDKDSIIITGQGRLLIRNIAMCFDAYLEKKEGKSPVFSRTI